MVTSRFRRDSGFTMVEFICTMGIITVLAISVAPKFFSTTAYNQQVYYDEIINSIRYARKLAVAQGTHIQVNVNANALSLQQRIEGSSCNIGTQFLPINDPMMNTKGYLKLTPRNVALRFSTGWPIYFNGLGQALHANDCHVIDTEVIVVSNIKTVSVLGETGFVQ